MWLTHQHTPTDTLKEQEYPTFSSLSKMNRGKIKRNVANWGEQRRKIIPRAPKKPTEGWSTLESEGHPRRGTVTTYGKGVRTRAWGKLFAVRSRSENPLRCGPNKRKSETSERPGKKAWRGLGKVGKVGGGPRVKTKEGVNWCAKQEGDPSETRSKIQLREENSGGSEKDLQHEGSTLCFKEI